MNGKGMEVMMMIGMEIEIIMMMMVKKWKRKVITGI
jgi:hypothetical protein